MNFNGNEIAVDAEGYLKSIDDWREALAAHIAEQAGLTMTEAHWDVVHFVRAFYLESNT